MRLLDDETDATLIGKPEEAEKGAELIEEFMSRWAKRSAEIAEEERTNKASGDEPPAKRQKASASSERQVAALRSLVEEYRPRMEADPWVKQVLETF